MNEAQNILGLAVMAAVGCTETKNPIKGAPLIARFIEGFLRDHGWALVRLPSPPKEKGE